MEPAVEKLTDKFNLDLLLVTRETGSIAVVPSFQCSAYEFVEQIDWLLCCSSTMECLKSDCRRVTKQFLGGIWT